MGDRGERHRRTETKWPDSDSTIKLTRPLAERETLSRLRATLPAEVEAPNTGEHPVLPPSRERHDTPHTIVLPTARNRDRATLTMLRGPEIGATHTLEHDETTLGRGTDADIRIDEPSVSRLHARIVFDATAGSYLIEDLGSTNGTFVAGRKVRRARLENGDRVQLGGEQSLRFAVLDEEEETLQRRLYEASMRDPLTNLVNRRCLFDRLTAEMTRARRSGCDLAVLMIDVDHFKSINDRFGHAAGDQVLRAIALTGSAALRENDVFARYGGEEFAVLIRDAQRSEVLGLAERLRGVIEDLRVEVGGGSVALSASIGGALLSECAIGDGLELFARADARLYAAKAAGRNRVALEG